MKKKTRLRLTRAEKRLHDRFGESGALLTAAQLGELAEQLPGASPEKARLLEEAMVAGFYGTIASMNRIAEAALGGKSAAKKWLRSPCQGLGGSIPEKLAKTKSGRLEVKSYLIGIGNGNFQ